MSKVSLSGSPTGTATFNVQAPATNTNRTITLPDSSGQVSVLDLRTAVTASGTAVDFLNIPATARRITVMFNGVSTNGTSNYRIQLGAGSIEASGYVGAHFQSSGTGVNSAAFSAAFEMLAAAAEDRSGVLTLTNSGGNTWTASATFGSSTNRGLALGGAKTLSGTLDRIRITTANGTDTFDAGTINIMVE